MLLSKRILGCLSILILSAALLFSPAPASALQPMTEGEMDLITGQRGFSEVKIEDETAKVWLNIDVETNARIGTFKANYDPGNNPADVPADEPDRDWDQAWYDVTLGQYNGDEPGDPLSLQGFILEAAFDDISSTNRRLVSLKMGFDVVNGELSADFASFSGFGHDSTDTRQAYYRETLGQGAFTFADDPIHMIMHARGYDDTDPANRPGIYMDFGEAQFN